MGIGVMIGLVYNILARKAGTPYVITFVSLLFLFIIAKYLNYHGTTKIATSIVVYFLIILIFFGNLYSGGDESVWYFLNIFPLVVSAYLLDKKVLFLNSLLTLSLATLVYVLQRQNNLPDPIFDPTPQTRLMIASIAIFIPLGYLYLMNSLKQKHQIELLNSEQQFRALFEYSPNAVILYDNENDRILDMNPSWCKLFGTTRDEYFALENEDPLSTWKLLVPEYQPSGKHSYTLAREFFIRALDGEEINLEWQSLDMHGNILPLYATVNAIPYRGKKILRITYTDLRRLKQAESSLLEAAKYEKIGKMAGGMGHDLNNIFQGILGYNELIFNSDEISDIKEQIENQRNIVEIGINLVSNLLAYSRSQKNEYNEFSPADSVNMVLNILNRNIEKNGISIEKHHDSKIKMHGDQGRFTQIIMNIIANSIESMEDGGTLSLSMSLQNQTVEILCKDTGIGIPEDQIDHIFELLYTTKEQGSGLGLFIANKIVNDIGGELNVKSKLNEGTEMIVRLPLTWKQI
jgi:PAS domain S-box-containing protein